MKLYSSNEYTDYCILITKFEEEKSNSEKHTLIYLDGLNVYMTKWSHSIKIIWNLDQIPLVFELFTKLACLQNLNRIRLKNGVVIRISDMMHFQSWETWTLLGSEKDSKTDTYSTTVELQNEKLFNFLWKSRFVVNKISKSA